MKKRLSFVMLLLVVASLWATQGNVWAQSGASNPSNIIAKHEPEPGDDRGGHGKDDRHKDDHGKVKGNREAEPGDDRGGHGHGKDDKVLAKRQVEPGDDRGGHGRGRGKDDSHLA